MVKNRLCQILQIHQAIALQHQSVTTAQMTTKISHRPTQMVD
ncbi:hypothetical protein [Nostoc sp. FACHB-152]|nr:hypothetical protein [Nostoc sp. FACHB-152]